MLKARVNSDPSAHVRHGLELKLGYADEGSNESYLGLSDADFAASPYRRYAGSALDRMEWTRTLAQLTWSLRVGKPFELKVTAYRNDFSRAWSKLDRLEDASNKRFALDKVLANPSGTNKVFLAILRGEQDSDGDLLILGTNDRRFVSQGIQADGAWSLQHERFSPLIRYGARLLTDEADRRSTLVSAHDMPRTGGGLHGRPHPGQPHRGQDPGGLAVCGGRDEHLRLPAPHARSAGGAHPDRGSISPADRRVPRGGAARRGRDVQPDEEPERARRRFTAGSAPFAPGQGAGVEPELSTNYEAGTRFERRGDEGGGGRVLQRLLEPDGRVHDLGMPGTASCSIGSSTAAAYTSTASRRR